MPSWPLRIQVNNTLLYGHDIDCSIKEYYLRMITNGSVDYQLCACTHRWFIWQKLATHTYIVDHNYLYCSHGTVKLYK